MGCGRSRILPGGSDEDYIAYYLLSLTNTDIKLLVGCFHDIDINRGGSVDLAEIYTFYSIDDSPYMKHIFHMTTRENYKEITKREFILCTWHFLTRDEESLKLFTFQIYDYKLQQALTMQAMRDLVALAFGSDNLELRLSGLLEKLHLVAGGDDIEPSTTFDYSQFERAVRISPHLLQHVMRLQDTLRAKILGRGFWKAKTQKILRNPDAAALFLDYGNRRDRRENVSDKSGRQKAGGSFKKQLSRRSVDGGSIRHLLSSKDGGSRRQASSKDGASHRRASKDGRSSRHASGDGGDRHAEKDISFFRENRSGKQDNVSAKRRGSGHPEKYRSTDKSSVRHKEVDNGSARSPGSPGGGRRRSHVLDEADVQGHSHGTITARVVKPIEYSSPHRRVSVGGGSAKVVNEIAEARENKRRNSMAV